MRVTVIRDDGVVGVDGVFRAVDLSGMPEGLRAVQWNGARGHVEFYDSSLPNVEITSAEEVQQYIDLWNAANPGPTEPGPPKEPTPEERRAAAHERINAAYEEAVGQLVAGYPAREIESWAKQEIEARAWLKDRNTVTPWIDSAAVTRGIPKPEFIAKIIEQADALAPMHGALSGKRQYLRDQIDALANPTQEELDAIQW